jgi:hypothetical protein
MLRVPLDALCDVIQAFGRCEAECSHFGPAKGEGAVATADRERWLATFERFRTHDLVANWVPYSVKTAGRLCEALKDPTTTIWHVGELIRDLNRRMVDEFSQHLCVEIEPSLARLALMPTEHWARVVEKFPDSQADIFEAGWSLAVERHTAAVFHLMRVLEHGLRTLAARFDVPFAQASWHRVISDIEEKIGDLRNRGNLTDGDRALISFASQSATEFRHFKDAWRNHVSHAQSAYDLHQARSIYGHVYDFMCRMASES